MFMYISDNVSGTECEQKLTILIPPSKQGQYFKGNLESSPER